MPYNALVFTIFLGSSVDENVKLIYAGQTFGFHRIFRLKSYENVKLHSCQIKQSTLHTLHKKSDGN